MGVYPEPLEQLIISEVESFFRNRFVGNLKFVAAENKRYDDCYSARIAIKSSNANGFLAVNVSKKTLEECHPERRYGDEITNEDIEDWVGEIVNRILGNIKNGLLDFNIETTLNPPECYFAEYTGDPDVKADKAYFQFATEREEMTFLLQVAFTDAVSFDKSA